MATTQQPCLNTKSYCLVLTCTPCFAGKIKAATMAEVQVLASLNHPNIVKFLDCFMDDSYINIGRCACVKLLQM
jgi:serine/threonine protein kinase